jgi:hypothetical protein
VRASRSFATCAPTTGSHTNLCVSFGTRACLYTGFGVHHGSDNHLAYGNGTNLDYCEVMATTVDYDMTIITLDNIYSVLSCHATPPDALHVQYG